jgi:poly[(R)-3-hydroxyalkanoate] polymerase subunit PhaC
VRRSTNEWWGPKGPEEENVMSKTNDGGREVPGALPFEPWSEWLRNNLGQAMLSTFPPSGGRGEGFGGARDPLLSVVEKVWEANPLSEVLPINWVEITRALQTLWAREMRDPESAMQRAVEYNRRLFETTVKVWDETAARFWGSSRQEEEGRPDRRFSAPEWEGNPYYQMLKESYLLASDYLLREAQETNGEADSEEQRRLKFHLQHFVDAMAPVNFLLTNPAALRRILETGGMSLIDGARNLISDIEQGRITMTDATAFEPGENLAISPGKVVYRNRLIELIQYEPQTEQVHEVPLLWVPPWINKYYILDMKPKNSFVKYMVEQGFTLFIISWKNPDVSMEDVTFEDYMVDGPLKAAEVVRDITGSETVNPMGYCIGGTLLAMTLAYLEAVGENKFGPATFIVSLQDFSEVGDTSVFIDEPQIDFIEQQMMERGYLEGRSLYNMFNLLRSNDLIWSNVVNNYLMGQKPPAFDLLYWNSDSTRMTRAAHSFYLRNTYLENNLIKPGKIQLKHQPIDLGRIRQDIYAVGAQKDHIVPWQSAWKIERLTNSNTRFVLGSSGHIAGIINPPSREKGSFWTNEAAEKANERDEWFENATKHNGSWWTDWVTWLGDRSGEKVEPPSMGTDTYPPIENAPGSYVKER